MTTVPTVIEDLHAELEWIDGLVMGAVFGVEELLHLATSDDERRNDEEPLRLLLAYSVALKKKAHELVYQIEKLQDSTLTEWEEEDDDAHREGYWDRMRTRHASIVAEMADRGALRVGGAS